MSEAMLKGLLLAGGHGTRLRPLTFTGNKHMIPIANEPMVFYGLRQLAAGGITDVGIVLGPLHEGIQEAVKDGGQFGVSVTYIDQGAPKGLAHAVSCARDFLKEDPFVMYLGDNLLQEGVSGFIGDFNRGGVDAVIGASRVPNPESYGVIELEGDRILSIEEKPDVPKTDLALIGVYLFTSEVHPIIERLQPSKRGELEITEAIWQLHKSGKRVAVRRVQGWWKDTGRPEDLLEANDRVLETSPQEWFAKSGRVVDGADVSGRMRLGDLSTIGSGTTIQGPVVIGKGVRIDGASRIGPNTAIGDSCTVTGSTITRSIVMEGAEIRGPVEIQDSIVGRSARIAVGGDQVVKLRCILGDSTQIAL